MGAYSSERWFDDIDLIIREPLRFKASLDIGENVYKLLKAKNIAAEIWDTAGAATTAASVAKSSVIASKFFAPKGILGALGIGTAATPIGWVIAAGVVTGGAWFGITHYMKRKTQNHSTVIPSFINTPIDVLALGLFDLIAPLAMKVAMSDKHLSNAEIKVMQDYFVQQWGFDETFVCKGLEFIAIRIDEYDLEEVAKKLAEFQKQNPDCNHKTMPKGIIGFLTEIMHADGKIDTREEDSILKVEEVFKESEKLKLRRYLESKLKPLF